MLLRTLAVSLLLVLSLAGSTRAQDLGDAWFKVTLNLNGAAVLDTGEVEKTKGKVVAYLFVQGQENDPELEGVPNVSTYDYTLFTEAMEDVWVLSQTGTFLTRGAKEELMIPAELGADNTGITWDITVPDEDMSVVRVRFVARLKRKLDKQAELKSASFKSLGAVVTFGVSDTDTLYGLAKIKGKRVKEQKLPAALLLVLD